MFLSVMSFLRIYLLRREPSEGGEIGHIGFARSENCVLVLPRLRRFRSSLILNCSVSRFGTNSRCVSSGVLQRGEGRSVSFLRVLSLCFLVFVFCKFAVGSMEVCLVFRTSYIFCRRISPEFLIFLFVFRRSSTQSETLRPTTGTNQSLRRSGTTPL